jgi:Xaa-Pro aminopeptidase
MDARTMKNRVGLVRRQLTKRRINCLLLAKPANVTYVTGFSGRDSWAVLTKRSLYLLTDSRYTEQARVECVNCRIIERTGSLAEAVAKLVKKLKTVRTISVEDTTSVAELEALKKQVKARLRTVSGVIESVRSIKDNSEVLAVKRAGRIAAQALMKTTRAIKPGITENELAGLLDFQIRKLGATNSFPTIVAFGANASRPHHQPSMRKLKKNDTILIDFGAGYKGYCSDITRCLVVGRPSSLYKKVYNAVRQAQQAAIKMIKAGVEITKVDTAARKVIAEHDLPVYGHGTGHGLGLEIHEGPVVAQKRKGRLKAGQVITIEPGVYIPGKLGVRIEDDILVTRNGCKILSSNCPYLALPVV